MRTCMQTIDLKSRCANPNTRSGWCHGCRYNETQLNQCCIGRKAKETWKVFYLPSLDFIRSRPPKLFLAPLYVTGHVRELKKLTSAHWLSSFLLYTSMFSLFYQYCVFILVLNFFLTFVRWLTGKVCGTKMCI